MYENRQICMLQKCIDNNIFTGLTELVNNIKSEYEIYNSRYERYTGKYIETIENIFNKIEIEQFIPIECGGMWKGEDKEANQSSIKYLLEQYIGSFENLPYLRFLSEEDKNVVFVGPNGSGKTTLLRKLIQTTGEENIGYYAADRLLLIDENYSPERDLDVFIKQYDDTDKKSNDIGLRSQSAYVSQQVNKAIALFEKERYRELDAGNGRGTNKIITDEILEIWNNLINDRILYSDGGLKVKTKQGREYPIKYLSSGEKSVLYFLICIFLKSHKNYYFIDEPENNLNTAIVSKLWDIIEERLPDSTFVYLTHDNNFVSSRVNCNVFWVEKYDGERWEYHQLPSNEDIPKELLIELVGSRLPILFCESHDESRYDAIMYKILFPEFKVIPAGGCDSVIAKTKAYKLLQLPQKAYGIVDRDYRDASEIEGNEKNGVYTIPFFEVENFMLCEPLVKAVIAEYSNNQNAFEELRCELKKAVEENKELWCIHKVGFCLRKKFFGGRILNIKNLFELEEQYNEFVKQINIKKLYDEYLLELNNAVTLDNYDVLLKYYDNKGVFKRFAPIIQLANKKMYEEVAFDCLKKNKELAKTIRKQYLPLII